MSRILIVEDSAANRALLSATLQLEGYEILTAADGWLGVELAQCERPDLILMDVLLSGLNELEAARRLKARNDTRHIPIIARAPRGAAPPSARKHWMPDAMATWPGRSIFALCHNRSGCFCRDARLVHQPRPHCTRAWPNFTYSEQLSQFAASSD